MIYIEPIQYKWEPGKMNGKKDKKFEDYLAKQYVKLVKKRVDDQKFKSKWKSLNPLYLQWKIENNLSPKTWEATGELIQGLKVKKNNVVGFDNRRRHKVSGETYIHIARKLEYGDSKVPARPLFRLVLMYMRKNVKFYYDKYQRGD